MVSTVASITLWYFPCFHTTNSCSLQSAVFVSYSAFVFFFQFIQSSSTPKQSPFSAITNSFILHLKLYGTKKHLPPTNLAMYSIHCLNMPLFLPLQCNMFCYHGPEQMIKNPLCVMLRVTYYKFFQQFWDFSLTPLVNNQLFFYIPSFIFYSTNLLYTLDK